MELAALLRERLETAGRTHWAEEEFALLEEIRHEASETVDPVSRVKGAKDLSPRELARLRASLHWRDEVARALDRALFRVVDDRALMEIATNPPSSARDLGRSKGFSSSLARDRGEELLSRLAEADAIPEAEIPPFPRPRRSGPGRPPPDVEARLDRIKSVRNRLADALGLDRGTLLPNAGLLDIAMDPPTSVDELKERRTIKRWQIEAVGAEMVEALERR